MKDEFKMYGGGIKPVKSTGNRWIDHRIRSMQRLVDKYESYTINICSTQFLRREKLKIAPYFKESSIN